MFKNRKVLLIVLGLIIFFMVGYGTFMGLYFYTSEPDFCAKCHYVAPYVSSWQEAPHAEVKCLFCHEPSGGLGKLHSKTRGINYLLMHFTETYSVFITAEYINVRNCLNCHIGENQQYPNTIRIDNKNFDHIKSIEKDQSCLECHNTVGHDNNIGVEKVVK